jgi:hypothetical protein
VEERNWSEGDAGNDHGAIEPVQLNAGAGGVGGVGGEGVGEDALQHRRGGVVGVERQFPVAMREAQRAEIVQTEDVICVCVGVEDSIDVANAEAQRLLTEVRPGVDEDTVRNSFRDLRLPFDSDGGAEALVARIA